METSHSIEREEEFQLFIYHYLIVADVEKVNKSEYVMDGVSMNMGYVKSHSNDEMSLKSYELVHTM